MRYKEIVDKETVESTLPYDRLIGYLISSRVTLPLASYLTQHHRMPMYDKYLFATYMMPNIDVRWLKMEKKQHDEDIEAIMGYYVCNEKTAIEYHDKLSKDQMKHIKMWFDVKGTK